MSDININTFTQHPGAYPTAIFPNHGMQILTTVIHLIGLTVSTYCIARRSSEIELWSLHGLSRTSWPKLCTLLVFLFSWAFIFTSSILITGTGLSLNLTTCSLAIWSCIFLYISSKLLIYLFLIEKVHIVWTPHATSKRTSRLKSPVYQVCMLALVPFIAVLGLALWGRVAQLMQDRSCVIGLTKISSLSLLCYDLFMTIFLTGMFVWPLWRATVNPRLRAVAIRTLIASIAALTTSAVNITVLTIMHGRQLGWVCLSCCGTDVTINALVLYWVTNVSKVQRTSDVSGVGGAYPGHLPETLDISKTNAHRRTGVPSGTNVSNLDVYPLPAKHTSDRRRVTMFAEPAAPVRTMDRIPEQRGLSGFFRRVLGRFGHQVSENQDHAMSVQVTVITEHDEMDVIDLEKLESCADLESASASKYEEGVLDLSASASSQSIQKSSLSG
ncbi:hypothetical protein FRC02_008192 [Tulasnella sp. 418]|nr:hypothetical protein FRC02_008192 [Tulasnella sp. 418]